MRPGRHAADDSSFGRSAGTAAGRGALLLAAAMVIGIVVLNAADDSGGQKVAARSPSSTLGPSTTIATTTTVALRTPSEVKVIAANGTKTKGVATKVTDTLKRAGYNALAPTDAPSTDQSIVYATAGFEREAAELARLLDLGPTSVRPLTSPPPVADIRGANIVVVVGPELASRLGGTTSTTARRSTTSTTAKP